MAPEQPSKKSSPPKPPEGWTRCHAYLKRKSRFCHQQQLIPSSAAKDGDDDDDDSRRPRFCGNHHHLFVTATTTTTKRRRIPCPFDPTHSIAEDAVDKHMEICPKLKIQRLSEQQSYFCREINAGGSGAINRAQQDEDEDASSTREESLEWAQRIALAILETHQRILTTGSNSSSSSVTMKDPCALARLTLQDIHAAVPTLDLSQPEFQAGLAETVEDYRIKSGGQRHLHQQASLVGHLRRIRALPAIDKQKGDNNGNDQGLFSDSTLVEVGAGRGMMGLVAAGVQAAGSDTKKEAHLIMVERGALRTKADTILRKASQATTSTLYMNLRNVQWTRIQCDLSHVDMAKVVAEQPTIDSNRDNKLVIIAKHLCGVGTDLALKSLEPVKDRVQACVLATCCHGVCSWRDYVGRDYLCQAIAQGNPSIDFGAAEFELLRRWSSGSVLSGPCSKSKSTEAMKQDDQDEHSSALNQGASDSTSSGISVSAVVQALRLDCGVQGLGRACQRLIDFGRQEYLANVIFASKGTTELLYYVPADITPQNAVLVAHR